MKKLILCAACALFAQTAFALAPLDRSIHEIRDIVTSPELRRFLPRTESILDIRRVDRGYLLLTNRYQLFVEVVYGPYGASAEGGEEGDGGGGASSLKFNEPQEISK